MITKDEWDRLKANEQYGMYVKIINDLLDHEARLRALESGGHRK